MPLINPWHNNPLRTGPTNQLLASRPRFRRNEQLPSQFKGDVWSAFVPQPLLTI